MKSTIIKAVLAILFIALIINISDNFISCSRIKKAEKSESAQINRVNIDSIKSEAAQTYRAEILEIKKDAETRLKETEAMYKKLLAIDNKLVIQYRDAPGIQTCGETLASKNNLITNLEEQNRLKDTIITKQEKIIISFEKEIQQKDSTVQYLSKSLTVANQNYIKEQKPVKYTLGVFVGYGIGKDLKPGPVAALGVGFPIFAKK